MKTDWRDAEVVVDGNLVTSRRPEDLTAFCRTFIDLVARMIEPRAARALNSTNT